MKTKQTKTQRINAMVAKYPDMKPKEIAKRLGVSPNLVHQVKYQAKKNSEFVNTVFTKAGMKKPSKSMKTVQKVKAVVDAIEKGREVGGMKLVKLGDGQARWVKADMVKKQEPSKIIDAVQEMKATLDALDKIKDKPKKVLIQPDHLDKAVALIKTQTDIVNHPPHYKAGGIETIDFIEAKDLNYRLGNVVKYVSRAGKKLNSDPIEDLEKALWYLQREIDARDRA